ncbi:hypothetical protein JX266_005150 [Neoarthrinium moseri]|nr:hypothetical protein JX266_005150 [Neoarthrinium moseri]
MKLGNGFVALVTAAVTCVSATPLKPVNLSSELKNITAVGDPIEPRKMEDGSPWCRQPTDYSNAGAFRTMENIDYLRRVGGLCPTAPGSDKGQCNRVACQWRSAIYVCNDNDFPVSPECNYVADLAQIIFDKCRNPRKERHHEVHGFANEGHQNWSVVVADGDC